MRSHNPRAALAVLCLAEMLVTIDNTVVNVALPSLSRQLSASTSGLQWTVDAYTLAFGGLLLAAGHLGDRVGRRRALVVGTAGFGAVSAVAANVNSLGSLVAARAVMGGFAALVFPATLAIITTMFTGAKERAAAVGAWSGVAGLSVALGPLASGWLLGHFSWHAVFWVNVPLAAVIVTAALRVVPESRAPRAGRFDVAGAALATTGLTTLLWSVIEGPRHGWGSPIGVAGFAVAALLLWAFVVVERRTASPLVPISLFADRRFSAPAGAIAVASFGLFGFTFLITQYFQAVKGYSTWSAGVRTLPFAVVIGALSPVALRIAARVGTRSVLTGGLVVMAAGFALAARAEVGTSYLGLIVASMVLIAAGLALISGPATQAIMGTLPAHRAGAGSAVNDTTREVGGTLGVAVLGSALAALYGARVSDALRGLPVPVRVAARRSVEAGVDAARRSGRQDVAAAVREAFVAGLHTASLVAAGAVLLGAIVVAWVFPGGGGRRCPAADAAATRVPVME